MKHCTHCGTLFPVGNDWPKTCGGCGKMTWKNPTPVAVLLIPVETESGLRLVGIRRQNTVRAGHISPPGGFVTLGETWQEAAARETKEETNIDIDPETITAHDVVSTPDGVILIFGITSTHQSAELPEFIPNHEASERIMITPSMPLAFPIHTRVVRHYFTLMEQC